MSEFMFTLYAERLLVLGDEDPTWGDVVTSWMGNVLRRIALVEPSMVVLADNDAARIEDVTRGIDEAGLPLLLLTFEEASGHGRLLIYDAHFPELACPRCLMPSQQSEAANGAADAALLLSQVLPHVVRHMDVEGPAFVERNNFWVVDASRVRVSSTHLGRLDGCTHHASTRAA